MQRWWFMDKKSNFSAETHGDDSTSSSAGTFTQPTSPITVQTKLWQFRVHVTQNILNNEQIAITGSSIGNWKPDSAVIMNREEGTDIWTTTINIQRDCDLTYRYFICARNAITNNLFIRRWETHLNPRVIHADDEQSSSAPVTIDTFGEINGEEKIDRGWLTTETVIQFKFFNNPFKLKQKLKNRLLYVKLTPMNLRIDSETSNIGVHLDESLSNDTRENGIEQPQACTFTEVVALKYPTSVFEYQAQFGQPYYKDDIIIFNVTVAEPDNVAYLIDLYTYSSRHGPNEPPYHLGYHYILPNVLRQSNDSIEMPITCASNHRPLGLMNIDYVKIKPLSLGKRFTMKHTYIRYWNKKWTGLDVGHRGAGTSFKTSEGGVIRENTIASLKKAAAHGADMVEFDVQLSKDLVPVIYHDFLVYVSLKRKKSLDHNDMLELPMSELTLEQLKNLKVYHLVEGRTREPKFFDEDLDEHQPFPQLSDAFDLIDEHVGFNIEVKWSMQLIDGTKELDRIIDKNLYVDCILKVVLAKANSRRRIVFSCFDPDLCTMLRFKQNLYPVMFLTLGVTARYPAYSDPRCNTIECAVCNASAMELLGIVAHTEDLLRDSTQINLATDLGLVVFCWGDDNNSLETIQLLKTLGIHAIIYDKMDKLSNKPNKESIFLIEAKDSQNNDLLRLHELEYKKLNQERNNFPLAAGDDIKNVATDLTAVVDLQELRQLQNTLSTATSLNSIIDTD